MTKIKVFNVYSVSELREDVRKKVLDKYGDFDLFPGWWGDVIGPLIDDMGNCGIDVSLESFDLERNSFRFKVAHQNTERFLSSVFRSQIPLFYYKGKKVRLYMERLFVMSGDNKLSIEVGGYGLPFTEEQKGTIQKFLNDWTNKVSSALRESYEYRSSDECVIGCLEANEFEFFEDGTDVPRG